MTMTTEIASDSRRPPFGRPATSPIVRWLLGLFLVLAVIFLLTVVATALFALRMWIEERTAARAVEGEVARLRAADQPMTADDLYRMHRIPASGPDATAAWLAAIKLATGAMVRDAKAIPYVGDGDPALL